MIDETMVGLMTKITLYEQKEQHKAVAMSRYYKRDYVRYNVLKTWIAVTVVYWAVFAAYIYMNFEDVLAKINQLDYFGIMYKLLYGYAVACGIFFLFSSFVYGYKYEKAKPGLAEYNGNLKKLIAIESGEVSPVKVVKEESRVSEEKQTYNDVPRHSVKVNRMELMRKQQEIENSKKEQEIIENVRRRKERVAAQNEEQERLQREAEEDRQRIRERRQQIEKEQMEKLRNERLQKMNQINRQNHTYSENDNDTQGGEN